MTTDEFKKMVDEAHSRRMNITATKNVEYTQGSTYGDGGSDYLSNFKKIGLQQGLNPLTVLLIYFQKHHDALISYSKHKKEFSTEGIEGRIDDMQNYLDLARGLIVDGKKE